MRRIDEVFPDGCFSIFQVKNKTRYHHICAGPIVNIIFRTMTPLGHERARLVVDTDAYNMPK